MYLQTENSPGSPEAVKKKYAEDLQTEQSECSTKILEQLRTCVSLFNFPTDNSHVRWILEMAVAPSHVGRMNYESFVDITLRHRVIPVNWPVTFKPPSKLTVLELHSFHAVLHSDNPPVLFRQLTSAEWAASQEDIANGTSHYLIPPFRDNASPMPTPLLLTGLSGTASPSTSSDDPPPHNTASPAGSDPAGLTADARTPASPSTGSLTLQTPQFPLSDSSSTPQVQLPGPKGGAVLSFGEKVTKTSKPRKGKKTKKSPAQKAAEKAAKDAAKALEKEAAKAAKVAAKAAAKKKAADAKKAAADAKKAAAAAKKAAKTTTKKGGKKVANTQSPDSPDGNVVV